MDTDRVDKTVNSIKKKIHIISAIYIISTVALIMITKGIWFAFAEILLMIVVITALFRVYRLDYLMYDLCDPVLYYYTIIGLTKKEPPLQIKQKVAEQTGDFTSAAEFAFSRINLCKKDIQKLPVYIDILRIAFDAGDFILAGNMIKNINSLKVNQKIVKKYNDLLGFYSCCIDGNYYEAKEHFDNIRFALRKNKSNNLVMYKMTYCEGLLSHSLGDYENAKKCFEIVADGCPKLNIAAMSRKYLSGTAETVKTDLSISAEKGKNTPVQKPKIEIWRLVTLVISLIAIIISGFAVRNSENEFKGDTIESAISAYHEDNEKYEILFKTNPDENSIITVCKDTSNRLSVEYLKQDEDYECLISCIYESYELNQIITGNMSVSGISKTVHFIISRDKKQITDDYTCTEISYDDKSLYFGYRFAGKKLHLFNKSVQMCTDSIFK